MQNNLVPSPKFIGIYAVMFEVYTDTELNSFAPFNSAPEGSERFPFEKYVKFHVNLNISTKVTDLFPKKIAILSHCAI